MNELFTVLILYCCFIYFLLLLYILLDLYSHLCSSIQLKTDWWQQMFGGKKATVSCVETLPPDPDEWVGFFTSNSLTLLFT